MNQMLRQAQKMQKQMAKMQEELSAKEYEASAGGDMVVVRVNGKNEVLAVKIQKEVVDPTDIGMLEDLVRAGVNAALGKAAEDAQNAMKSATGGLGLPGL
ncbi:MAG: YbaB/EbfC family nucleoid-associated protein [Spirochaetes bacterium]|nr:YbaB/EbfC family nucleoid-associated protein [Spirochaetota bacterium]